MIGLLDPALFLPRDSKEIQHDLDLIIRACKAHSVALLPVEEYWSDLWSSLARPLERALSPEAKRSLQELRKLAGSSRQLPHLPIDAGKVWRSGFDQLFCIGGLEGDWEKRMAEVTLRSVLSGEKVVIFVRRMLGRNLEQHRAEHCVLDENTRWVLHVHPRGIGHQQILCIYHPRNLSEEWTTRFDWRLPASSDGATYPFCPPDGWWKRLTPAHRTGESKPVWVDKHGNFWARPNIPGGAGYHWDVFIQSPSLRQTVGLDQLNVVEFGTRSSEGGPGQIHHEPGKKAGKITGTGWTCK